MFFTLLITFLRFLFLKNKVKNIIFEIVKQTTLFIINPITPEIVICLTTKIKSKETTTVKMVMETIDIKNPTEFFLKKSLNKIIGSYHI